MSYTLSTPPYSFALTTSSVIEWSKIGGKQNVDYDCIFVQALTLKPTVKVYVLQNTIAKLGRIRNCRSRRACDIDCRSSYRNVKRQIILISVEVHACIYNRYHDHDHDQAYILLMTMYLSIITAINCKASALAGLNFLNWIFFIMNCRPLLTNINCNAYALAWN